nr:MAG TPA: nucleophosmin protein [Caudoviricetes sp.]
MPRLFFPYSSLLSFIFVNKFNNFLKNCVD